MILINTLARMGLPAEHDEHDDGDDDDEAHHSRYHSHGDNIGCTAALLGCGS
jgi:hypothetical protein